MKKATLIRGAGVLGLCAAVVMPLATGTVSFAKSDMHHASKVTALAVASVTVDKTAQTLQAAPGTASSKDEATFVLTAKLANGHPAAGETVTYYIGAMKPLGNVPPKVWIQSGTKAAARFIARDSVKTNAQGKATLVLLGQRADSMEMVGIKVGDLSGYNVATHKATASLDAWWTTPRSHPTAPIGDYVTVYPFMASASTMSKQTVTIGVYNRQGQPIKGAHVVVTSSANAGVVATASAGMNVGGMGGVSASADLHFTTSMSGQIQTQIAWPAHAKAMPVRIVVTQPSGQARIAGGMNIEYFAN